MLRLLERLLPGTSPGLGVYCVLLFPDSAEGRWFKRPPHPGTRLRSQGGDLYAGRVWVVDEVLQSGRDIYTVSCVGRAEYNDKRRQGSPDTLDLAAELLEVARRTSRAVSEQRRRRRYRNYIP